jgi:hypothetical protein
LLVLYLKFTKPVMCFLFQFNKRHEIIKNTGFNKFCYIPKVILHNNNKFNLYKYALVLRVVIMQGDKKARIGVGTIKGAIIGLIFLTVLVSILPDLILDSGEAVNDLSGMYAGNSTVFGSGASDLGGSIDEYAGWFFVLGPFILIITVVLGVFMTTRR